MTDLQQISVYLPSNVITELDKILVRENNKKRNDLIREAMVSYIEQKKKAYLREMMCSGYQEMGVINLKLAQEWLELEERERSSKNLECR